MTLSYLVLCSLWVVTVWSQYAPVPLNTFNAFPMAKCLDGTRSGYYVQTASAQENINNFVIYIDGMAFNIYILFHFSKN